MKIKFLQKISTMCFLEIKCNRKNLSYYITNISMYIITIDCHVIYLNINMTFVKIWRKAIRSTYTLILNLGKFILLSMLKFFKYVF